jgi:hypothetical protein
MCGEQDDRTDAEKVAEHLAEAIACKLEEQFLHVAPFLPRTHVDPEELERRTCIISDKDKVEHE